MKAASQIVVCASSFAALLLLGHFFDLAFWQARFHAESLLGGKPLPRLSQFFISNHHLPPHLALLPWLALVGAPLLRSRDISYWEFQSSASRYLAFLAVELLLFLMLLLALVLPFLPYYAVLEPVRQNSIEFAVQILAWLMAASILVLAIRRISKLRKGRHAPAE